MPSVAGGLLDIRKNGSPSLEEHRRLLRSDSDDGKKDGISLPSDQSTTSITSSASSSSLPSDNEEVTSNGKRQKVYDDGHSFLKAVTQLILDEWNLLESSGDDDEFSKKNSLIVEFKQPKELETELNLSISRQKPQITELLSFCQKVIRFSVKTTRSHFYNQLYGGIDEYSLAGSWLTDALNTSQATYETSPVFTVIERFLFKFLGSKCEWKEEEIDGIFSPGGSMANIYGMILARHDKFPEIKKKGVASCGQLVMFASEDSHYSFVKGSFLMGHGSESVIKVKTDENGCMCPIELERCIQSALEKGSTPFLVACTAGTTVLGAFDPIDEIVSIAKRYNLWTHVDAALGGTVLFSSRYRHLMNGVEGVDSITWNLHKMGGIPLQCSIFLTRHAKLLLSANSLNAEYLFQSDKYYDSSYDSGDKSIQCGRKVDSLKLYLGLVGRGEDEMESLVDNVFSIAAYATDKIQKTPGFRLVLPQGYQGNNVCFWYIPRSLRQSDDTLPHFDVLHKVAPAIKAKMMTEGKIMVNYQPLTSKKLPNFFRLVLTCVPPSSTDDMDFFIDQIAQLGETIQL